MIRKQSITGIITATVIVIFLFSSLAWAQTPVGGSSSYRLSEGYRKLEGWGPVTVVKAVKKDIENWLLKRTVLNSSDSGERAKALRDITNIAFLKDYALKDDGNGNLRLNSNLSNAEIIAILDNNYSDEEAIGIIINSLPAQRLVTIAFSIANFATKEQITPYLVDIITDTNLSIELRASSRDVLKDISSDPGISQETRINIAQGFLKATVLNSPDFGERAEALGGITDTVFLKDYALDNDGNGNLALDAGLSNAEIAVVLNNKYTDEETVDAIFNSLPAERLVIVASSITNLSIKEQTVPYLLNIFTDVNLSIELKTFSRDVLVDINSDSNVNPAVKEGIVNVNEALKTLVLNSPDSRERAGALVIIADSTFLKDYALDNDGNGNLALDAGLSNAEIAAILNNKYTDEETVDAIMSSPSLSPESIVTERGNGWVSYDLSSQRQLVTIAALITNPLTKEKFIPVLLRIITDLADGSGLGDKYDIWGKSHDTLADIAGDSNVSLAARKNIVTKFLLMRHGKEHLAIAVSRADSELRAVVAQYYGLSGVQLDIWNDFGMVAIDDDQNFSEQDISLIYSTLQVLPSYSFKTDRGRLITASDLSAMGRSGTTGGDRKVGARLITLDVNKIYSYKYKFDRIFFVRVLLHEIGHQVDFSVLTNEQYEDSNDLHTQSGNNPANYARGEGLLVNRDEDFATMFEDYTVNTVGILTRAKLQADNGDDVLLRKVALVSSVFVHEKDGVTMTYVFSIDAQGSIARTEVELGADGLPVI